MKKILCISLIALLAACKSAPKTAADIDLNNFKQKISYALGADSGTNFKNVPKKIFSQFKQDEIEHGFKDFLHNKKSFDSCNVILSAALGGGQGIDTSKYKMSKISYCYGALFGNSLRHSLVSKKALDRINMQIAEIGFKQSLLGEDTLIPVKDRNKMIVDFNNDLNKMTSKNFMDSIKKVYSKDAQPEGYVVVNEKKGNGAAINPQDEYQILLSIENVVKDTIISTYKRNTTNEVQNTEIINADSPILPKVWKDAIQQMVVGGTYTIYTPYSLGFGEKGLQNPNPPYNYVVQPFQALIIHAKVLKQQERYTAVKELGEKVIAAAKKKPNTYVDPSGFIITTLRKGDGKQIKKGNDVQVQYILTNAEGSVVENSYIRSQRSHQPAPTFSSDHVIKGWKDALMKMKVGGHYTLVLPYNLAYGEKGNSGIGPYETLTFDISILQTGPAGSLVKQGSPQQGRKFSKADMERLQKQLQQGGNQ